MPCANCGKTLVIKWGRNGEFLACPATRSASSPRNFTREEDGSIVHRRRRKRPTRSARSAARRWLTSSAKFGKLPRLLGLPRVQERQVGEQAGAARHRLSRGLARLRRRRARAEALASRQDLLQLQPLSGLQVRALGPAGREAVPAVRGAVRRREDHQARRAPCAAACAKAATTRRRSTKDRDRTRTPRPLPRDRRVTAPVRWREVTDRRRRARRQRGRLAARAARDVGVDLCEMRPRRCDRSARRPTRLAELVCSNSLARRLADDGSRPAQGARCARLGFADHAHRRRDARSGRLGAGRRSRACSPSGSRRTIDALPGVDDRARRGHVDSRGRRRRSSRPGRSRRPRCQRASRACVGERAPVLLRRDLADPHGRIDRHERRVPRRALRQGRRRLHQLPDGSRAVRRASSTRCSRRRRCRSRASSAASYFEGCMPIEEIARRGRDTLRSDR